MNKTKKINDYIGKFPTPFLCEYRKQYSTQYVLLSLMKRLKIWLFKQVFHGTLLMDLSKAFGARYHEIRDSKFHACGCYIEVPDILLGYLQER